MKSRKHVASSLTVPPGTESLPLAEKLHIYLYAFESGCSRTHPPVGNGKPEEYSECVRAFVDAVKSAVDEEIEADPMGAFLRMARATTGACPACGEEGGQHKEGCRPSSFKSDARIYTPPAQKQPKCSACGQLLPNHIPGCPKSFSN
jgi:hypothetical protein